MKEEPRKLSELLQIIHDNLVFSGMCETAFLEMAKENITQYEFGIINHYILIHRPFIYRFKRFFNIKTRGYYWKKGDKNQDINI